MTSPMDPAAMLVDILAADPWRQRALKLVHAVGPPDCWVAAGLIRTAVWDHLHGRAASRITGDVDVIRWLPEQTDAAIDLEVEAALRLVEPSIHWSVKNQTRMHVRNGDAAYVSAIDAMRYWPETATAIAVRHTGRGGYEIEAPFGLDDLFALILRPTPRFQADKLPIFLNRIQSKGWLARWPLLRVVAEQD